MLKTGTCPQCGTVFPIKKSGKQFCESACGRKFREQFRDRRDRSVGKDDENNPGVYMPDEATIYAEAARFREIEPRDPVGCSSRPYEIPGVRF